MSRTKITASQWFGFTAIVSALLGTTAAFWSATSQRDHLREVQDRQNETRVLTARDLAALRDTEQRLAALQHEADGLAASLQQSKKGGKVVQHPEGLGPEDRQALEELRRSQAQLGERLSGLEGAILQSPEKAIGLPMLKQELTDMQDRMRGDADALHGEVTRVYGLVQVLLGLMFTLILGIASLVFNVLKSGDKSRPTTPEPKA